VQKNRNYWFLLSGLIVLMLSSGIGCVQPGFTTYTNEAEGYSINYPQNWGVEVSADGTTCLITSPTRIASVMIYVADSMAAQTAAQYWMMSLGTHWAQITQIENRPMEGFWNWYVSYEYLSDNGLFHGEAYFKRTGDHLYRIDTAADSIGYKDFPFPYIISSFKLK
jgi:hypothetical protein